MGKCIMRTSVFIRFKLVFAFIMAIVVCLGVLSFFNIDSFAETGDEEFTSEDQQALEDAQSSLKQIEKQQKKISSQISSVKSEKKGLLSEKQLVEQEIELINEKIEKLENYIESLGIYISKLEARKAVKNEELEAVTAEYDSCYEKYTARIRENYETDFGLLTYLEIVLSSRSITEILTKIDAVRSISDYQTYLLEKMKNDINTISDAKFEIETDIVLQNKTLQEQNDAIRVLEQTKLEREDKEVGLSKTISSLEKDLSQYQDELERYEKLEAELEKEITKLQDKKMRYGGGTLMWPLPSEYHTITSGYGQRTLFGKKDFHYAIDIQAPKGTPIYAAADGKIIYYSWTDTGGGNKCVIDHGSGLATHYNHMSAFVSKLHVGSEVKKGDVIGYVGMTGTATGNHLDFKILVDGVCYDPSQYVTYDGSKAKKDINDLLK